MRSKAGIGGYNEIADILEGYDDNKDKHIQLFRNFTKGKITARKFSVELES